MSRIFDNVPAFAPDYSGAASVLHDMGGMIVYCCVGGCMGNYAAFDEPRLGLAKRNFSIAFREQHLVMGIDKMAKEKIVESYKIVGGKFVALIGTPTSTIIGTDYKGLAVELEKEIGVPVIYVETTGLYSYESGQEKTYRMLSHFAAEKETGADVHVIGATPLDAWDYGQMGEFKELLVQCGAKAPAFWGAADTLEHLGQLNTSKLNIAVSKSAVALVRELHEKYGTPYLIGFPVGKKAYHEWQEKLTQMLSGTSVDEAKKENAAAGTRTERILIVGEQVASNMLRDMLRTEFGYETVNVASFFTMDPSLAETGDFYAKTESDYVDTLSERENYDLAIGDNFLTRALPYETRILNIPSIAISGLVFMRQSPVLFGEKGTLYFQQMLEEEVCV